MKHSVVMIFYELSTRLLFYIAQSVISNDRLRRLTEQRETAIYYVVQKIGSTSVAVSVLSGGGARLNSRTMAGNRDHQERALSSLERLVGQEQI